MVEDRSEDDMADKTAQRPDPLYIIKQSTIQDMHAFPSPQRIRQVISDVDMLKLKVHVNVNMAKSYRKELKELLRTEPLNQIDWRITHEDIAKALKISIEDAMKLMAVAHKAGLLDLESVYNQRATFGREGKITGYLALDRNG